MDAGIVAAWAGVVGAVIVGLVGWVLAGVANSRAKKANELAAHANRHAAAAVEAAEHANRVAEAANQLSEEANTVVRGEAAKKAEQWFTQWGVEWDAETVILTNKGGDPALDAAVVINGQDLSCARRFDHPVARGMKLRIPFPEVVELRADYAKKFSEPGLVGFFWGDDLEVIVIWRTGLGQPREQRFQLQVG